MQYDGAIGITGPVRVFHWAVVGRPADRVQCLDEVPAAVGGRRVESLEHSGAHPGHDAHRTHYVRRVGELDADLRVRRVERSHAEGYHVHGPALHTAREPLCDRLDRIGRAQPVAQLSLGRTPWNVHRVPAFLRAYERPALHPGHVPGTASRQKASQNTVLVNVDDIDRDKVSTVCFGVDSAEKQFSRNQKSREKP